MKRIYLIFVLVFVSSGLFAQAPNYTEIAIAKHTSVKDQAQAGSCWSFATTSFIESEVLKLYNIEVDISEMFFVYYGYINRAEMFVRLQGHNNFGQGGQAHDVIDIVKEYGIVPEDVYPYTLKNHTNLEHDLKSFLDSIVALDNLPTNWLDEYTAVLNEYLSAPPTSFKFANKDYSPTSFTSQYLQFNPDDYVEISSYKHHNLYEQFVLEVPDNWSLSLYYNVSINELLSIIDSALVRGYSIVWDGDVSEPGFSPRKGLAFMDRIGNKDMTMTAQAYRQTLFDNQTTTDDHLMHAVGVYEDKDGLKQYLIKNSWGVYGPFDGYLYMSEDYVKYHTVAILVNKNIIPENIKKKIGI